MRLIFALPLLVLLTGCTARSAHAPLPPPADSIQPAFLDLQAGWRLRVVVPILKSGGYLLPSLKSSGQDFLNLRAGPDFLGYENDYYAVIRNGHGMTVEFRFAEVVQEGETTRQSRPRVSLFNLPANMRFVRLVYLVRVSEADHNMAIAGAEDQQTLASLTGNLQSHPEETCAPAAHSSCAWVPPGIAVRPERRAVVDGKEEWVPAPLKY
jgi:hypothetical protein